MIDEDLYQQAADELNTDKRRPHIWARACALASDDHDEARYLYTNLRVEELIAEREAGGGSSAPADVAVESSDGTLALEPLDFDEDSPESVSTPAGMDQNVDPEAVPLTLNSAVSGTGDEPDLAQSRNFQQSFDAPAEQSDSDANPSADEEQSLDVLAEHDDFLDETINLTSELDGTAVFELDKSDSPDLDESGIHTDSIDVPKSADISAEEELEALLDGVYDNGAHAATGLDTTEQGAETADFSDVSGAHDTREEDLDWLEKELTASDSTSLSRTGSNEDSLLPEAELTLRNIENTDQLAQELERQADQMPGQHSDVIDMEALPTPTVDESTADAMDAAVAPDNDLNTDQATHKDEQSGSALDSIFDSIEHEADELNAGNEPDEALSLEDISSIASDQNAEESIGIADVDVHADDAVTTKTRESDHDSMPEILDPVESVDHVHPDSLADSDTSDSDEQEALPAAAMVAASGTAAGIAASKLGSRESATGESPLQTGSDSAGQSAAHVRADNPELPLDLVTADSRGTTFMVYRRDAKARAVSEGVSWPALFLTLPCLLYRQLFGTALVYIVTWLILMSGLLVCSLAWLDASQSASHSASLFIKAGTIGFAILAIIGLLYLPFRQANRWLANRLEHRGFEAVARIRERSAGKAIARARQAALLD